MKKSLRLTCIPSNDRIAFKMFHQFINVAEFTEAKYEMTTIPNEWKVFYSIFWSTKQNYNV